MLQPDENNRQEPISQIEDLDPEPARGSARWRNLELVLGCLLVIGTLSWALGTWLHDSAVARSYKVAQQAASERRWDDALAGFSAARGYMDADARATEAARQVDERDSQYRIAAAYEQATNGQGGATARDAISALSAARAVQTLGPGYKDVDSILVGAQDQLVTASLSNTVALRD